MVMHLHENRYIKRAGVAGIALRATGINMFELKPLEPACFGKADDDYITALSGPTYLQVCKGTESSVFECSFEGKAMRIS